MANCNGWSIVHFTPPDADLNGEERFSSFFLTFMGEMPDGFKMGMVLCPKIFQKKLYLPTKSIKSIMEFFF